MSSVTLWRAPIDVLSGEGCGTAWVDERCLAARDELREFTTVDVDAARVLDLTADVATLFALGVDLAFAVADDEVAHMRGVIAGAGFDWVRPSQVSGEWWHVADEGPPSTVIPI